MNIAVTGAGGFIGRNVMAYMALHGHHVEPLPRGGEDDAAILGHTDVIFHLSAYGQYPWMKDNSEAWASNVFRTETLLKTGIPMVYAGTSVVADTSYCVTKRIASEFVEKANGCVLKLFSVYGPGEDPRRLLPRIVSCGKSGTYPPLANPDLSHDFVYVDDVCAAFLQAATTRMAGSFDIGTGVLSSLADVAGIAKELFGIPEDPVFGSYEKREWDTCEWPVAEVDMTWAELGWKATTTLRDGMAKMAALT